MVRLALVLALALLLQAGLGRFWADAQRYVDVLLVPVVFYGLVGTQRTAMLAGCAAGLLHDAWFQFGTLGLCGFKRTLLGWGLGGLGSRLDLNHPAGRFVGGTLVSLIDTALDWGLRRLLDREQAVAGLGEILIKAVVSGLLVLAFFAAYERVPERWKARGAP